MQLQPTYVAYRAGSAAARLLPDRLVDPLTGVLGRGAALAMSERRAQVARNLQRVCGPGLRGSALRHAVEEVFESYTRYWLESFRLPGTPPAVLDAGFSAEGFHHISDACDAGRGVILALPHLGGWEWAAFWLTAVRRLPVTAVAESLAPPELAEWFVELRRALGMDVVPLGPGAGSASVRALKANRVLCLVCDRDIEGGGVSVEFFGETTTLPGGPATLALRTGAPLVPAAVYFERSGHHAVVGPPLAADRGGSFRDDVGRITQALARRLEELIRRAPTQWHLLQPNWPSDG